MPISPSGRKAWDDLAALPRPSWYLDAEVALQKRRVHQELVRRWAGVRPEGVILKTDLFEEAWGEDGIYADLFEGHAAVLLGTDIAEATVARASAVGGLNPAHAFVCDLRALPVRPFSLDLILSMSSLDHFDSEAEFHSSLMQLCSALRPGGTLVITLDNPANPLYRVLRMVSRMAISPFRLGFTPALEDLRQELADIDFEVLDHAWLIHNPRLLSTAVFGVIRLILGRHAGPVIRLGLRLCALQERLWTRRFSACFYAIHARKRSRQHETSLYSLYGFRMTSSRPSG